MPSLRPSSLVVPVVIGLLASTGACTLEVTSSSTTVATGSSTTTSTTTTTPGGGGAGQGGGAPDACGGVSPLGECSADKKVVRACIVPQVPFDPPRLVETTCGDGAECATWKGTAACRPAGACFEGRTECAGDHTVRACQGGKWLVSDCGATRCVATPGAGASCMQEDGQSAGITLRGHLDYEYKKPAADLSDYTKEVFKEGAVDMFVTVYEGDEIIGMGLTSPGDGKLAPGDFELTLSKAPTTKSNLYFWPLLFDDSGSPRLAVAKAKSTKSTEETSDAYYSFGFATCATDAACAAKEIDAGALLVDAAHDSGVIHIFQWLDYTLFRVEGMPSLGRGLMSLVAFWAKDNAYECGSCWVPPQLGLPTVTYDAANQLTDYFDSGLAVSGTDATPDHWSRSAINHELGHWTMHSYAVAQGGCGGDLLDEKSQMSPDIAFDEGFATFFGQANVSHDPSDNEPITFRKSQGTVFWADLGKLTSSLGKLPLPAPGGKLDQPLNPNVAAGMLWSLWAGKNAIAPQNLGDAPFFAALPTYRFTNGDRGFAGTDLVDYLDALTCDKGATLAQIGAVTKAADFPYDSLPTCQ